MSTTRTSSRNDWLERSLRNALLCSSNCLFKEGTSNWAKQAHGHGGFIRGEVMQSSPGGSTALSYSVYPFTAKHNLRCVVEAVGDGPVSVYKPMETILSLNTSNEHEIFVSWDSNELGWHPTDADSVNLREGEEARPVNCKFGFHRESDGRGGEPCLYSPGFV
jgi:hypothetical protein